LTYKEFKQQVIDILKKVLPSEDEFYLEKPILEEHGELASTICFKLSKKYNKSPVEISQEIEKKLKEFLPFFPLIKDVKAVNGYLNFYINEKNFVKKVLEEIENKKYEYGKVDLGKGRKVLVEHTNTNPNKAIHIGHARNTCLGDSLVRILRFGNYKVYALNYLDDTGSQMADLIIGFKILNFPLESNIKFDKYCGDFVYVKVNEMYETSKELLNEKQKIVREIDKGDNEYANLSKSLAERILKEQLKTCYRLGAKFDLINWESDIIKFKLLDETLSILKEKKLIEEEKEGPLKGCIVIRSKLIKGYEKETDKVLIRSDGSSTYIAKDIAYAFWKLGIIKDKFRYKLTDKYGIPLYETSNEGEENKEFYAADLAINVIDVRQTKLQDIIKILISYLQGKDFANRYLHYKYEVVALSRKAAKELGYETDANIVHMSGRKGLYFNTDDILDKLKEKIKERIKKNHPEKDEKVIDELSEKIAVSALRYALLRLDNDKILVFDFDETLKIEGDSGVYVLYTYVRIKSILRKAKEIEIKENDDYIPNDLEIKIVKKLAEFEDCVINSITKLSPQLIILYLRDLCDIFNSYYEKIPILHAEKNERYFRLRLIKNVAIVLEIAMNLVGLIPIEEM